MQKNDDGLDIVSYATIFGAINGEPYEGEVEAHFNTLVGGTSRCTFTQLPDSFSPGTIGTHT